MSENKTIVLASGGTGGHIFPAEALAEELKERGYTPVLITDSRHEQYVGKARKPYEARIIHAGTLRGNVLKRIAGMLEIIAGYFQARALLKKLKPAAVVGFGGYPSFPTMMAGRHLGLKSVIHEQNSRFGKVNALLAPKVDAVATSFPEMADVTDIVKAKITLTGNPVRPAVRSLRTLPYPDLNEDGTLHILIIGGSQGASVFAEVLPEAIALLPQPLRARLRIDQQCRPDDVKDVRKAYSALGINADIATFFRDLPVRLASAHLVITRAGASTVAELAVAGRPSILVPYPHATDDHQRGNATALEDAGGGWVMPQQAFTPTALSARLEAFLSLPSTLSEAAEKARSIGRPDAAKLLADVVEGLAK